MEAMGYSDAVDPSVPGAGAGQPAGTMSASAKKKYKKKKDLQTQGLQSWQDKVTGSEQREQQLGLNQSNWLASHVQDTKAGMRDIQYDASKTLSAAVAGGPQGGPGAAYMVGGDAANQTAFKKIAFRAAQKKSEVAGKAGWGDKIYTAGQTSADLRGQKAQFERTSMEDIPGKRKAYVKEIEGILTAHSGGLWDSNAKAGAAVRQLAGDEGNEGLNIWLNRVAKRIEDGADFGDYWGGAHDMDYS